MPPIDHPGAPLEPVGQARFRDVIGSFASGVTIITTRSSGTDFGTTASAVSSLSMDPPMLLACLNQASETRAAVEASGCFAVNILAQSQADLALTFARKSPDKFDGVAITRGAHGVPMLGGALAHLECLVDEVAAGGTHVVFFGVVHAAEAKPEGRPLTYFRGGFGRFAQLLD